MNNIFFKCYYLITGLLCFYDSYSNWRVGQNINSKWSKMKMIINEKKCGEFTLLQKFHPKIAPLCTITFSWSESPAEKSLAACSSICLWVYGNCTNVSFYPKCCQFNKLPLKSLWRSHPVGICLWIIYCHFRFAVSCLPLPASDRTLTTLIGLSCF